MAHQRQSARLRWRASQRRHADGSALMAWRGTRQGVHTCAGRIAWNAAARCLGEWGTSNDFVLAKSAYTGLTVPQTRQHLVVVLAELRCDSNVDRRFGKGPRRAMNS